MAAPPPPPRAALQPGVEDEEEGDDDEGIVDEEFLQNADQVIELDDDYMAEHAGEMREDEENDMEQEDDEQEGPTTVIPPDHDDSVKQFDGHNAQPVYALAISPNSKLVVSGGGDDCAYLWQITDPTARVALGKHADSVVSVAFNYNGTLVATGGMDGVVRVLEVPSGQLRFTLEGPSREIEFLKFHPSGDVLVAGSVDATAWMWDCKDASVLAVLSGHQDTVSCGGFTSNGRRILTGSLDGTLKVWEPTGVLAHSFGGGPTWHSGGIVCLAQDSGPNVATGATDGSVCVSRLDSKKILSKFSHAQEAEEQEVSVEAVAFCNAQGMSLLASAGTDARVVVWDLHASALRVTLDHGGAVVACGWLGASTTLVTACADALVRVWDARTGRAVKTLVGATDAILDMAVAPDASCAVTGGDDGMCRVWATALD